MEQLGCQILRLHMWHLNSECFIISCPSLFQNSNIPMMQVSLLGEAKWFILRPGMMQIPAQRLLPIPMKKNMTSPHPVPRFLTVDSDNPIVVWYSPALIAFSGMDPFTPLNIVLPHLFSLPKYEVALAPLQCQIHLKQSFTELCICYKMGLEIMMCFRTTVRTLLCIVKLAF